MFLMRRLITYSLSTAMLCLFLSFWMVGCNSTNTKPEEIVTDTTEVTPELKDSNVTPTDRLDTLTVLPDKQTTKLQAVKECQLRVSDGLTDSKLNGDPILIQLNLSEKIMKANPDTIKKYLKGEYLAYEHLFPRSIADNFEAGTSVERIHYPNLNYRVELFEDEYAKKPYKTLHYSVRADAGNITVQ
jgi:hypothetical protein